MRRAGADPLQPRRVRRRHLRRAMHTRNETTADGTKTAGHRASATPRGAHPRAGTGTGTKAGPGLRGRPVHGSGSPSPPRVDVTAFGSLHVDSFGDRTVELELRKQAADVPPGARPPFARLVTLAEAFVFDLRGAAPESPSHPRLETVVAGELRRAGKPRARVRGKLTTDLTTRAQRWFAAEARGDGGAEGGEMTCRVVTDFRGETETRARGNGRLRAMCVPGKVETRVVNLPPRDAHVAGSNPTGFMRTGSVDEVSHAVEFTTRVVERRSDARERRRRRPPRTNGALDARCAHEWNPETTRVRRRVGVRARRETRAQMARRRRGASRRRWRTFRRNRKRGGVAEGMETGRIRFRDRTRRRRRVGVVRGGSRRNATRSGSVRRAFVEFRK